MAKRLTPNTVAERLRPNETRESVTAKAAANLARIAVRLQQQRYDERRVAHFINKLVFCLFAEDIDLLPDRIFAEILDEAARNHELLTPALRDLFAAMSKRNGRFGAKVIRWFNGGLFDDDDVLELGVGSVPDLIAVARLDWSKIDPTIFGTLFESSLDEKKRAAMASLFDQPEPDIERQAGLFDRSAPDKGVGIHYTDPGTIMKIIEPVVMQPLRAEWDAVKGQIRKLVERRAQAKSQAEKTRLLNEVRAAYTSFRRRLGEFRVLDPACGSGNFLALALGELKDFDLAVMNEANALDLPPDNQRVTPEAVLGIEINPYAAELARLTVWITELQWQLRNGIGINRVPILGKLDAIACRDALMTRDGKEASWPDADVAIGNPPFLGNKRMTGQLGEKYVTQLRTIFGDRLPGGVDLVVYWFEKARAMLESKRIQRAGLVATNSIRGGANRKVLARIKSTAEITDAWSDEPWVIDGAAVRVSLVCLGNKQETKEFRLNGRAVGEIFADLTGRDLKRRGTADLTTAQPLDENSNIAFNGISKKGSFDVEGALAREWLSAPSQSEWSSKL